MQLNPVHKKLTFTLYCTTKTKETIVWLRVGLCLKITHLSDVLSDQIGLVNVVANSSTRMSNEKQANSGDVIVVNMGMIEIVFQKISTASFFSGIALKLHRVCLRSRD